MTYKTIMAAIDITNEAQALNVLRQADQLATLYKAKLEVITVLPSFGMAIVGNFFPKNFESEALEKARQALEDLLNNAGLSTDAVEGHVRHGTIYEEILDAAKQHKVELIVMGAHRPELSDYLLGPNAARVVRHAPCSVHVMR